MKKSKPPTKTLHVLPQKPDARKEEILAILQHETENHLSEGWEMAVLMFAKQDDEGYTCRPVIVGTRSLAEALGMVTLASNMISNGEFIAGWEIAERQD